MKICQGPQFHKACSVRGGEVFPCTETMVVGRRALVGSLSAGGNELGSVPISVEPTNVSTR